jgi:KUP system potassium uptake protein
MEGAGRPATDDPRGSRGRGGRGATLALGLAALGVVFGDIGTSPLYALQTLFSIDHGLVHATPGNVYGVISLVVWSITLVVSVKYVTFIMRASNDGEGGIMALIALIQRFWRRRAARNTALVLLGVFGVSLFYGDSVITPAISVLSAVEGVKVAAPSLGHLVVEISVTIIALLFAIQRFGTQRVGALFGPVMVVWFVVIGAVGVHEVVLHPSILRSISPTYAAQFVGGHPYVAFVALGAVVLAITGAEALYADMGHFGRKPISRAWFVLVFPALTLNYLGQGSLILNDPSTIRNPFFLLVPGWGQLPMVILATVATVIASQSVISGAFSVSRQAAQLGFLPRLTVRHTSEHGGQVYVPAVNGLLFVAVVGLIVGFGSSARLATAYGVAVTGTFVINTILFLVVARIAWRWRTWKLALAGTLFLGIELTFFAANLSKVETGGWIPLAIAVAVFTVMTTWQRGREIVTERRTVKEGPLRDFITGLHAAPGAVSRVPGTAVFLHPTKTTTPLAMRATVEHHHVLHEHVAIVSIRYENVPYVHDSSRFSVDDLGYADDGIVHVGVRFGFQETPDVPGALALLCGGGGGRELQLDLAGASFFLSRISIQLGDGNEMNRLRKKLFVAIAHNAASPVEYFCLPDERTVVMGSHVDV